MLIIAQQFVIQIYRVSQSKQHLMYFLLLKSSFFRLPGHFFKQPRCGRPVRKNKCQLRSNVVRQGINSGECLRFFKLTMACSYLCCELFPEMIEKRELKPEVAVDEYIHFKVNETKIDFPIFIDEMTSAFGPAFILQNPQVTAIEFHLARVAIDCHYLWFLFPQEMADEIFRLIYSKHLKFAEFTSDEVAKKLFRYMDILDAIQSAQSEAQQSSSLRRFSEEFLETILGPGLKSFYAKGLEDQSIVDPLIITACSEKLMTYNISWKAIRETAKLY